ncbi:MAG TPA: glutathione S-transferase [Alphaproteobacteria bacterium]|nr:glutathione S-transferase [Alphaproteobacteria bacterium]
MYQLYYYPNFASLAPHMVLEEIGAPFQLIFLDRAKNAQKAPKYLRLNPHGRIPTLVEGDLVLYEAAAICLHLCDRHPSAGLAPEIGSNERAHFYKWLIYLTNTLQAEMMPYYYPDRWAADDAAASSIKRRAEANMGAMLEKIESALMADGPYLLGKRFSAADLYFLMLCGWTIPFERPARSHRAIARLLETVASRAGVKRAYAAQAMTAPFY